MDTPKTILDYEVASAEASVRVFEIKVREAKDNLEQGYIKAKAEMEREYSRLKSAFEIAQCDLERSKAWLEVKKADQTRGFENN
ncbi:MAG: hypothetical protein PHQ12_03540 [Chthoniobacteraceae bacterium]|nr:hypothetical protein [Chthoniobacteraceae bacterium]